MRGAHAHSSADNMQLHNNATALSHCEALSHFGTWLNCRISSELVHARGDKRQWTQHFPAVTLTLWPKQILILELNMNDTLAKI